MTSTRITLLNDLVMQLAAFVLAVSVWVWMVQAIHWLAIQSVSFLFGPTLTVTDGSIEKVFFGFDLGPPDAAFRSDNSGSLGDVLSVWPVVPCSVALVLIVISLIVDQRRTE